MSDFIVEHLTKSVGDKTVFRIFPLLFMLVIALALLVSMGQEKQPCLMLFLKK